MVDFLSGPIFSEYPSPGLWKYWRRKPIGRPGDQIAAPIERLATEATEYRAGVGLRVSLEVERLYWNAERCPNESGRLNTIEHLIGDADDVA
jgi:hypothetical protein